MKQPAKHQKVFFVPGEIVLHIQHPVLEDSDKTSQLIINALRNFLPSDAETNKQQTGKYKKSIEDNKWLLRLRAPAIDDPIITFGNTNNTTFSLVPIQLADRSEKEVLDVLFEAYSKLNGDGLEIEDGIRLSTLCPNWISRNLHHGIGTGGPGSWPTKLTNLDNQDLKFKFAKDSLNSLQPYQNKLGNNPANVAILDTLMQDNANLRHLFPYVIGTYYPYHAPNRIAISHLSSYTPRSEHYRMPDHGTFIASIVNAITPKTSIYVYEVLNEFGVGSYISIAWGLSKALQDLAETDKPLIINCSFMLSLPDGEIDGDFIQDLEQNFGNKAGDFRSQLGESLRAIFEAVIQTPNVVVVASAGNDSSVEYRFSARYPAALEGVLGVGALPKGNPVVANRYKVSSYSNLSFTKNDHQEHKGPEKGFMVFSGELDQPIRNGQSPSNFPLAKQGVVGKYIGKFPRRDPANNIVDEVSQIKLAHWAGTSFAAPIITGLLAAQAGNEILDTSLAAPSLTFKTAEGENVIVAQQG